MVIPVIVTMNVPTHNMFAHRGISLPGVEVEYAFVLDQEFLPHTDSTDQSSTLALGLGTGELPLGHSSSKHSMLVK
jgi:hypothetical protein